VEINVADEQVEDRIDEAVYMFQQFHMDSVVKNYLKAEVTASEMVLTTSTADDFHVNERVTGSTSGAVGRVFKTLDANTLQFYTISGEFIPHEQITGDVTGSTATIDSYTSGTFDLKYF